MEETKQERIDRFFAQAQARLNGDGGLEGESRMVRFTTTLGIIEVIEKEAKEAGLSLSADFFYFRESVRALKEDESNQVAAVKAKEVSV